MPGYKRPPGKELQNEYQQPGLSDNQTNLPHFIVLGVHLQQLLGSYPPDIFNCRSRVCLRGDNPWVLDHRHDDDDDGHWFIGHSCQGLVFPPRQIPFWSRLLFILKKGIGVIGIVGFCVWITHYLLQKKPWKPVLNILVPSSPPMSFSLVWPTVCMKALVA